MDLEAVLAHVRLVERRQVRRGLDRDLAERGGECPRAVRRDAAGGLAVGGAEEDDLWDEAVRVILKSRRGSASLLQRALGIGYTRASRLIDLMTGEGIVGEYKGSKAREVLLTLDDWERMHATSTEHGASDE